MPGIGNLLQGECEGEHSSFVRLLQKSDRSQWLLSAATAAERLAHLLCKYNSMCKNNTKENLHILCNTRL